MRYRATIRTNKPETLDTLQPGQWIDYDGAQGRFMGRRSGTIWIAWGAAARRQFGQFAAAFREVTHAPAGS